MEVRDLHCWDVGHEEARAIQRSLREQLIFSMPDPDISLVAGADVSFAVTDKKILVAAVVLMRLPDMEIVEEAVASSWEIFPYIPGFLSFREAPPQISAFRSLRHRPDIVLFDGHGIAHPRGLGLASHMGLILGIPSIGCAKKRLVGEHGEVGNEVGSESPLIYRGEKVGAVLRTRKGVKPVFISPGHLIDLDHAVDVTLRCLRGYRLPEPVRRAHLLTQEARRKVIVPSFQPPEGKE